ncbi:MAG: ATP-dependent DNA helicase RecG [Clostridiales bacterium]|nr:ATP-dependent DNA helicase RecG [Clostridiales bacterium]
MLLKLNTAIKFVKGVGENRAQKYVKLGIFTVGDLLRFYPIRFEDWSAVVPVSSVNDGEVACVRGVVASPPREYIKRPGLKIYYVEISDSRDIFEASFFNQSYVMDQFKVGEEYYFLGKMTILSRGQYGSNALRYLNSPQYIRTDKLPSGLTPVYRQTAGLSSKIIQSAVKNAFDSLDDIEEPLPEEIVRKYSFISKKNALYCMHFPKDDSQLERAKKRLAYEELFLLQIGLIRLKAKNLKSTSYVFNVDYTPEFCSRLPFELTGAQKRAISECVKDMKSASPMNRLLQGDVGSGKTAVAAALIYNAVKNGCQAALMAPTEVLAVQHYNTMSKFFFGQGINIRLLTGSVKAKEKRLIKEELKNGECDLVIGTHAVIQKDVVCRNVGLVITDEQHRFGVNQRGELSSLGKNPHTLVMSATPIPRTLSFIIFGDLDLSVLDEMPAGRQRVETYLVSSDKRERAYSYVKKHLVAGRQGYLVCPLVENKEDDASLEMKSATERFDELSAGFFRGFRLGLLYGKMNPAEKKRVMAAFAAGEIDLLISTTVIEVGVDVPNAVIMVIENAERFGLSQLHQLRGRVGRGQNKSTCILISDNQNPDTIERLRIMTKTSDGFKIADEDLRLRGPGDFFGSRQHGLPDIKTANLLADTALVAKSNADAVNLLSLDPELKDDKYDPLKAAVNRMFSHGLVVN